MALKNRKCATLFTLIMALIPTFGLAGIKAKKEPSSPPHVLVTVKPIHSLVAAIMEGIGTPELLIAGESSPHHFQLKPSEEKKLYGAQVVIWVGGMYETSLMRRMDNVDHTAQVITISELEGIELYPYRSFKNEVGCSENVQPCCDHHHQRDLSKDHHHHEISGKDGHLWLAPNNATVLVTQIAKKLAALDRKHAPYYLANSEKVIAKIHALAVELASELKDVKGRPYFTFHDFTQYFDRYFGTTCVGVVRIDPNLEPSPKHLKKIQSQIQEMNVCVLFAEPQFDDKIIKMLVKDSNIHPAQLDYLGFGLEKGPDLYFEMMRRLANDMKKALL